MNPALKQTYRRFLVLVCQVSRLCVPALLAVSVLTVGTSVPARAAGPRIKKPGTPFIFGEIAVNGGAGVYWSAPTSNGGSPITGYTVTNVWGRHSCSTSGATSCTVSGLTNGRRHWVTVKAANVKGEGPHTRRVLVIPRPRDCSNFGPSASLQGCDLANVNLTNVNLSYASLGFATLTGATLTGANLTGTNLTEVSSGGIIGTPSALPAGWSLVNGYLVGLYADLDSANLAGANLLRTVDSYADFFDANMSDIDLGGASLNQANLAGAHLNGADLVGAYFIATDFTGADLTNSNLYGSFLSGANFTGAIWSNTTCPDGSNSNNDGDTCVNNLS
jgi:uncharacterized protein YjbI with pentapeptide repeats